MRDAVRVPNLDKPQPEPSCQSQLCFLVLISKGELPGHVSKGMTCVYLQDLV